MNGKFQDMVGDIVADWNMLGHDCGFEEKVLEVLYVMAESLDELNTENSIEDNDVNTLG